MSRPYVIGVISDSHIPHRITHMPRAVLDWLHGSDLILHAGDVEDTRVLDPLRAIAPTHAVRGNVHWQTATGVTDQDLPIATTITIEAHGRARTIWMTHGHLNFGYLVADKFLLLGQPNVIQRMNARIIPRLARAAPAGADIVVFGHSHVPVAQSVDGTLFFNPGAVVGAPDLDVEPSVGRLVLMEDGTIAPEWSRVELQA